MDMAVGIIIGAAFTAIVTSLVGDVINPIIGVITGGTDFSGNYVVLNGVAVPEGASLQAAKDAGANVESVEGFTQAITLLKQHRVDATVNDKLTFLDYEKTDGPTGLKIAAETDPARSAVAATKDKTALIEAIDGALAELREDGTLAEISEKYFGADVTE